MTTKTHLTLDPAYDAYRDFLLSIAEQGVPEDASLVYENSRNKIYKVERNGVCFNIKCFRIPNNINSYVYATVRKSKARRSYEYALRLISLGFNTPQPVAYIERHKGLKLYQSYYVSLQIERHEVRYWENIPDNDALLQALAADMVKLHRSGVLHKDFSPGNILYIMRANGNYDFYYVDLNRMQFGVRSHKKLMSNFKSIHHIPSEIARLARYYAAAAGLDPAATVQEALRQHQKFLSKKSRQNRLKSLLGKRK